MRASTVCAALFLGGSLQAQHYRPTYQRGIDVMDYDFSLTLPDSGRHINGDVSVTFRRDTGTSRIVLDLVDSMHVREVYLDTRAVNYFRTNDKLEITVKGNRSTGVLRVLYEGDVADGLIVQKDEQGRWTWFGDNWPNRARQWLPTVDHPSDKATVTWRVTAPSSLTVVANGLRKSVKPAGQGKRTTEWREDRPVTTYVMVIAAAPLAEYDVPAPCHIGDRKQCVKQYVYVLPENRPWLPGVFATVDPIVTLFESLVGPFPYEKLAHLQSNTRFGGMENASAIFYDGKLFASQRVRDGLLAHETAHQWFGDAVTEREWGHLWLSEGFATYFAALWTRKAHGDSAFHAEMNNIRRQIFAAAEVAARPVIDTQQTNYMELLNTNSYQKGGFVLYMLNQELGDTAFFGALRAYQKKFAHGNALTDDLMHEFEKTSGRNLSEFFNQWLRRPGVAELTLRYTYDATSRSVRIEAEQTASAGNYALRMPVEITDAAGRITTTFATIPAQQRSSVTLPVHPDAAPRAVRFDPRGDLLARITAP